MLLLALPPLAWPSGASAQGPALPPSVARALAARESATIAFRRDLHRHPELAGQEARTAARITAALRDLGLEVRTGVGGHGVVATLRGALPGPVVAFRADMDAVATDAPDPDETIASRTLGVRHACGHDLHTTIGVAVAAGLAAMRSDLRGTVLFIFQPAEERATGARAMLADGLFATEAPSAILALHSAPLPVGTLGVRAGGMMAARDRIEVRLHGSGDLAAAARAVRAALDARATPPPPTETGSLPPDAVLVATAPAQRVAANEQRVVADLTLTSDARRRLRPDLERELRALGGAAVRVEPAWNTRVPGVTNDSAVVAVASRAMRAAVGAGAVLELRGVPRGFSEDFGALQERAPGAMYFLGVSNPGRGTVGLPHAPGFVADEAALLVGARAIAAALLALLASPSTDR
jgi:metal-dependent amidase/aminoacylase/carboxypeptidase family protein